MSFARRTTLLAAAFLLLFLALARAHAQDPAAGLEPLAQRARHLGSARVILEMRVPPGMAGIQQRAAAISAAQDRALGDLSVHALRRVRRYEHLPFVAAEMGEAGLRAAAAHPSVAAVHEDALHSPSLMDSGPIVGAPAAWALGYGGAGMQIAIVDTGVDRNHSFLRQGGGQSKVVYEACFSTNYAPYGAVSACPNHQSSQTGSGAAAPCSAPACLHGTHVAGIAAGNGLNATPPQGFSGIARDANLIAIQAFSVFSSPSVCGSAGTPCILAFTSDLMSALNHLYSITGNFQDGAGNTTIASVNMSLGGGQYSSACDSDPLKPAIDLLRSAGIAAAVASGNNGFAASLNSPGCISSAVSVGATTKLPESVAAFSNSAPMLSLLAPGVNVTSSVPGGAYVSLNGTSMATPHVAGAFAVLKQKKPNGTVAELLAALSSTGAGILDARNGRIKPRIQVDAALSAIAATTPVLSVTPPDGLFSAGPAGGPFAPPSRVYTLTNSGGGSLSFSASVSAPWAGVSLASGAPLAAGASTTATVSIGGTATGLVAGAYGSAVNFTNTVNGVGSTSRALGLTVTQPAPANDKFQDGILLTAPAGNTAGSNAGATKEAGEPSHAGQPGGKSVWWRWTAPASGQMTIDTFGSGFDTVLAVYTGASVGALVQVASNDNTSGAQSQVSFATVAGATYQIAVDGVSAASGAIALRWAFGQDAVQPGDIVVAPDTGLSASGPAGGPFTPPSASYTLTNISTGTRTFTVSAIPPWLSASPTSGTIAAGQAAAVNLTLNAQAAALAPGSYAATVLFNSIGRTVALTVQGVGVANDAFAAAAVLSGAAASASGSNVGASKEAGEPDHAGNPGGKSVWWRWTAPATGPATVDTFGSGFDTLLAVYTGSAVGALALVASSDDANGTSQSRVTFQAVQGVEYRIAVDGFFGTSGPIALHLAQSSGLPPANDAFVGAADLGSTTSAAVNATNAGATKQAGEPDHAGNVGGASVWWKWTAPVTQQVTVETLGSAFNTLLAVYTGSQVSALTPVAANDDADFGNGLRQSRLSFQAHQGTTYSIAVDGYNDGTGAASGAIALRLSALAAIPPGTSALLYFSQPGDLVGAGQIGQVTGLDAGASIGGTGNDYQGVTFNAANSTELWYLNFTPPAGASARLGVGTYEDATVYYDHGAGPNIGIGRQNYGDCTTVKGRFDVLEAVYDPGGYYPQNFAVNFVQYCNGGTAALFGQFRYNSSVPLDFEPALPLPFAFADVAGAPRGTPVASAAVAIGGISTAPVGISGGEYSINGAPFTSAPGTIANGQTIALRLTSSGLAGATSYATVRIGAASATFRVTTTLAQTSTALYLRSEAGDYIGAGQERLLFPGTGHTIVPSRNFDNGTSFSLSGAGEFWALDLAAAGVPSNAAPALTPGSYEGAVRFPFQTGTPGLSFSGAGRGCNTLTGRFDVLDASYAPDGSVSSFAANFEQHCEGAVPGLFGRVRYNSSWPMFNAAAGKRDLDGDGRSDVLWLNTSTTQTYLWRMNGAAIAASGSPASTGDTGWQVKGIADFDGDGKSDVLFRHSVSGAVFMWLMNGTTIAGSGSPGTIADLGWQIQGVGDFDGDGKADVLWMHTDGTVLVWFMNGTTNTGSGSPAALGAASGWAVQGVGDFDGNGKADILWKHTDGTVVMWMMNGASIASSGTVASVGPDTLTGWRVQGVGDFNGDGKADVLWRNDDIGGVIYVWLMNGTTISSATNITGVGTEAATGWIVKAIGDYDGDGKADVFWKNDLTLGGITYVWLMNGTSISSATSVTGVPDTGWQVLNPK